MTSCRTSMRLFCVTSSTVSSYRMMVELALPRLIYTAKQVFFLRRLIQLIKVPGHDQRLLHRGTPVNTRRNVPMNGSPLSAVPIFALNEKSVNDPAKFPLFRHSPSTSVLKSVRGFNHGPCFTVPRLASHILLAQWQ